MKRTGSINGLAGNTALTQVIQCSSHGCCGSRNYCLLRTVLVCHDDRREACKQGLQRRNREADSRHAAGIGCGRPPGQPRAQGADRPALARQQPRHRLRRLAAFSGAGLQTMATTYKLIISEPQRIALCAAMQALSPAALAVAAANGRRLHLGNVLV